MMNNGVIHHDQIAAVDVAAVGPVVVARIQYGLTTAARDQGAIGSTDPRMLMALLLAAFTGAGRAREPVAGKADGCAGLAERIRADVLRNLGDPELCAEAVARRHRISVRYLHKLFDGWDQTFAAWVRRQRLLRIRHDLLDPALSDQATAVIAARWGVLDTRHLGRAMKSEFGETVREIRRGQREAAHPPLRDM
jgi:AraC-like DNA-binding protein